MFASGACDGVRQNHQDSRKFPPLYSPQHGWTRFSCKSFKPAELWAERQRWKQVSPMLSNPAELGWTSCHNFPDTVCHPQKQQKLRRFWVWKWQWWCATYSSISQTFPHWLTVQSRVSQRTLGDAKTCSVWPNASDLDRLWKKECCATGGKIAQFRQTWWLPTVAQSVCPLRPTKGGGKNDWQWMRGLSLSMISPERETLREDSWRLCWKASFLADHAETPALCGATNRPGPANRSTGGIYFHSDVYSGKWKKRGVGGNWNNEDWKQVKVRRQSCLSIKTRPQSAWQTWNSRWKKKKM